MWNVVTRHCQQMSQRAGDGLKYWLATLTTSALGQHHFDIPPAPLFLSAGGWGLGVMMFWSHLAADRLLNVTRFTLPSCPSDSTGTSVRRRQCCVGSRYSKGCSTVARISKDRGFVFRKVSAAANPSQNVVAPPSAAFSRQWSSCTPGKGSL